MRKSFFIIAFLIPSFAVVGQYDFDTKSGNNLKRNSRCFRDISWVNAFDSLNAILAERYAFTEWKAIDWDEKHLLARPKILQAETDSDSIAFIKALAEYLFSVPDGHISIKGLPGYYKHSVAGGTYGFNMCVADDGSVLVTAIAEGGQAWEAGLRTGDKILKWNGIDIDQVGEKEIYNTITNYATLETRLYSRYLMLSRDSVGAQAIIKYSGDDNIEHEVELTAIDDEMQLLMAGFYNTVTDFNSDSIVTYKIIDDNIGYLKVLAEMAEGETIEEIKAHPDFIKMKNAIDYFNNNNVEKLIVDLRINQGGNDLQGAVAMGLFYENTSFYEYITATCDNNYEIIHTLLTEPLESVFTGDIAVIVDPNCISTGEGLVMMFDRLENAHIVSQLGTNGSFGMVDWDPIEMPLGISVDFPQARSLNEEQEIQLDSDSTLSGGIQPDIRIPVNKQTVIQQWEEGIDVQLEYAKSFLLSIYETNNIDYKVFPVPCSDKLTISFNKAIASGTNVVVYNIEGKFILQKKLSGNQNTVEIDVSSFKPGIYFWTMSNNIKNRTGRFVVSR